MVFVYKQSDLLNLVVNGCYHPHDVRYVSHPVDRCDFCHLCEEQGVKYVPYLGSVPLV